MSDSPIYDENMKDTPIYDEIVKPTPIYGPITDDVPVQPEKKWWEKILTPPVRRWAYGLSAAILTVGATWAGKPEFIPLIAPLIMALFYVDHKGEPRTNA